MFKSRKILVFQLFSFYEQLKEISFSVELSMEKKFYNLGALLLFSRFRHEKNCCGAVNCLDKKLSMSIHNHNMLSFRNKNILYIQKFQ